MREAGAVIDKHLVPIHWHLPQDRQTSILPDSRTLWEVIWEHRDVVLGFAHTHPGSGPCGPSSMDTSTFAAIEAGLGRRLTWWIVNEDNITAWAMFPGEGYAPIKLDGWLRLLWVHHLRELSNY